MPVCPMLQVLFSLFTAASHFVNAGNPFLPSDSELSSGLRELLFNPVQIIPDPQPWLPQVRCSWPYRARADDEWYTMNSPLDVMKFAVKKCPHGVVPGCELNLASRYFGLTCSLHHVGVKAANGECAIGRNGTGTTSHKDCLSSSRTPPLGVDPWYIQEKFSETQLSKLARDLHGQFQSAAPFPNVVIDNFLPWHLFKAVDSEIPALPPVVASMYCGLGWLWCMVDKDWHWLKWTFPMDLPVKPVESHFGPATRLLVDCLRSTSFVRFLEQLTGIDGLLPDPTLWGGGIHQTASQGYLGLHVDFPEHPIYRGLHRRVNVFLYLNGEWEDEYGGELEFWQKSRGGFRCLKKIRALANRAAIFVMSPSSWHGHPWPLRSPLNSTRRSMAFYYYTLNSSVRWGTFRSGTSRSPRLPCAHHSDPRCYGDAVLV